MTNTIKAHSLPELAAANVRVEAARAGMSQTDIAHVLGIARSNVGQRWHGKRQWQLEDLEKLAPAFGVEPADLLSDRWALRGSNPEPTDYVSPQVNAGFDPATWGLAA